MNGSEIDIADDALDFDFDFLGIDNEKVIINDPGVPFFHKFKYPLGLRSDLIIEGTVHKEAERFAIDFCQQTELGKDLVFHFSPRLLQNYVARNSFVKGLWGDEESHSIRKSPFERGEKFIIEIFLTANCFFVSVNNNHFCGYDHRVTPLYIDTVEIYGQINLHKVELSTKRSYPSGQCDNNVKYIGKQICMPTKNIWLLPLTYRLEKNLTVGSKIQIKGRIKLLPHCVFINLQTGNQIFPHPPVAYHASFRWNPKKEDIIVLNNWNEKWNEEIIIPMNLIMCPGKEFNILIIVKKEGFMTQINNSSLPIFPHRTKINTVNILYLQGDAEIYDIKTNIL